MSVFLVNNNHISAIVKWAVNSQHFSYQHGLPASTRFTEPHRLVKLLSNENLLSVNYRYLDKQELGEVYFDRFAISLTPVEVIKACHCLMYQSCEHEGWETSEAKAFLESVIQDAIRNLPGYDEAEWEIPALETTA